MVVEAIPSMVGGAKRYPSMVVGAATPIAAFEEQCPHCNHRRTAMSQPRQPRLPPSQSSHGTCLRVFHPGLPQILRAAGADFVFYDMEHSGPLKC
jgi:hypothetical protein